MAIGDAISVIMGPANTTRLPAAGVEEKITAIMKGGATDFVVNDGNNVSLLAGGATTDTADATSSTKSGMMNLAVMITNSVGLQKLGTTDIIWVCGVQTNA